MHVPGVARHDRRVDDHAAQPVQRRQQTLIAEVVSRPVGLNLVTMRGEPDLLLDGH